GHCEYQFYNQISSRKDGMKSGRQQCSRQAPQGRRLPDQGSRRTPKETEGTILLLLPCE
uniref:BPTI/Kunitz inhibitor domain-containing protein n=1 Tax=Caenorhabditis tropicalis TaxID=1561998 RepID=A0A1I7T687_9PELO